MSKPFNKKDPDDVNFLMVIIFSVCLILYSCSKDTPTEATPAKVTVNG